jgi:hypothetical protein
MSISTEVFYSSSNGDRWQLVHNGETGRYTVRHEPNLSSGGQVSEVSIPEFLSRSGRSPQAEALQKVLEKPGGQL